MGVAAHLEIFPAAAIACGMVVGMISVLGYRFLTPFLSSHLGIQVHLLFFSLRFFLILSLKFNNLIITLFSGYLWCTQFTRYAWYCWWFAFYLRYCGSCSRRSGLFPSWN